ncbi:hypothetical protein GCM10017083_04940 [Thalassobaculum fulvum]|uniref:Uncharacterized protein n=1 Tax=Thalassobaculum fulvum TaxID=1633335 RepID=A0A918XNF9_9PROT|nr:hypothetical protein [Thalassobaculum fulvum]GHD41049.1 hypothetical protein GCM10017083_04940 [Thalassobaculum fulvum]
MPKYFSAAVSDETLFLLRLQAALEQRSLASLAGAILTEHVKATEFPVRLPQDREASA